LKSPDPTNETKLNTKDALESFPESECDSSDKEKTDAEAK